MDKSAVVVETEEDLSPTEDDDMSHMCPSCEGVDISGMCGTCTGHTFPSCTGNEKHPGGDKEK